MAPRRPSPKQDSIELPAPLHLIGKGLALAWVGLLLWPVIEGRAHWVSLGAMAFLSIPLLMVADMLVAHIVLDESGLHRRGLLGRSTRIAWDGMRRVVVVRGHRDHRTLIVRGRWSKIALSGSDERLRPAARRIVQEADRRRVPVEADLLEGSVEEFRSWMAG